MKPIPSRYVVPSLLVALIGFLGADSLHASVAPSFVTKYAGEYTPTLTYSKGDIVKYGNKSYIALSTAAAYVSPASSSSSWTLFSELSTTQFGASVTTFTLDFVTIGNPSNSKDSTGYGGVPYVYQMGTYDITQNQINAAANDGLAGMPTGYFIGDQSATGISWYQAAAFVNWLNTNAGFAPAYNLTYSNNSYSMSLWPDGQEWTNGGTNYYRSANCYYFLPSENEWYKAAYYDPTKNKGRGGYWLYPTGSSNAPVAVASGTRARTAVYNGVSSDPPLVYQTGGLSPFGTMGQGGNVFQWMESADSGSNTDPVGNRTIRGGGWMDTFDELESLFRLISYPPGEGYIYVGFRVASKLP